MPDQRTITVRNREGRATDIAPEQLAGFQAQGFEPESEEQRGDRLGGEVQHELYGGGLGAVGALGSGVLSGLTLGASDLGIEALGGGGALRGLAAQHPYGTGIGTLAGAVLPTILTAGAAAPEEAAGIGARILAHSPAGLTSRLGGAIGGLGEGAGLAGRLAAGTAGAAAEGALYGGGQYLTETALEDKPLSAEGFVAGMGHGALFAAPIGGAATLASGVLQKARGLFPRSEVSAAAAAGVKEQATSALGQTVRDGDAMAAAAERKLSDVDAKTQMAEAGETVTRRVFGAAHPQALADQVAGTVDRQQVTQALEGYQQARRQFEDWASSEADPELEHALLGVRGGDLQASALAPPRVPVGEFGAPGAGGFKSQDELARLAAGTGRDEIEQAASPASADATGAGGPRALRSRGTPADPMGGVPAQEIVQRGMAEPASAGARSAVVAPREIATDDEFRRMQRGLRAKLTPDEIRQALRFSREHYLDVNRALRPGRAPLDPAAAAEITPAMDSVLEKSAIDKPLVTHRGVHFDPGTPEYELKPGETMYDPGFGSSSRTDDNIHRFGNIHLVITSPAGTHIAAIPSNAAEGELTLARGTSYKITDRVQHPDGHVTLRATVIKQDGGTTPSAGAPATDILARHRVTTKIEELAAYGNRPERLLMHVESPSGGGIMSAERMPDGGFEVGRTALDPALRDKGVGTAMYEQMNELLESKYGQPLMSAARADRSVPAEKLWVRLEQRGLAQRIGPEAEGRPERWVMRRSGTAAATDTLTGQLRGTAARIGEGESLVEMGAPARAEYAAGKAERTKEAAEHFRGRALAQREARAGAVAQGEERNPFHGTPPDEGPEVGDATMRRIMAKHGLEMAEPAASAAPEVGDATMKRILAKHGLGEPGPAAAPGAAEPDALAARIMRNAEAGGSPTANEAIARRPKIEIPAETPSPEPRLMTPQELREQRDRFRAIAPEQRAAKAIMRHNGKNADMGPGLARAAKVIGGMEDASAKLTDVLGADAPATAVENAKAYRTAVGKAQDQAASSSAKAAADLKGKVPAAGADATMVDDDIAKAIRKHDMRAGAQTAAAGAPAAAPAAGPLGSRIADAASALEVLRAIGAHVPAVSHIPVIGPVLGLFFKARAVMSILGRKGGSIGKSTESVIAGKAAATRERIVAATGILLEGGARAAGKVSHLAGPAVLLEGALFPGGGRPASDKPRDLFEARANDIVRAQQPGAIDQAIAQRYPTSDPAMHDAIVAQVQRGISFLDGKRPKQTVLPGVLPGDGTWKPSMASIEEFGKFVHAVNDPVSVIEDLAKGHPSAEGAETLRVVYPELYRYAQKELLAAAPEMAKTLPYPRRVMVSILYQIPVDGTMHPSHAQYLQVPTPAPAAAKTPASTGPLRLGQQTMSPLDRRASGA